MTADPEVQPTAAEWPLVDFLLRLRRDQAAGVVRPLREYLQQHPEAELAIAREYLLVDSLDAVPDDGGEPNRCGPFLLIDELGRGGEGVVYRARDTVLDRDVALKVFDRDGSDLGMARIVRSAATLARLDHPAIVRVFGAGRHGRVSWVSTEFVAGHSLALELERRRAKRVPFVPRELAALLAPIAHALHHAHERGVVHRDVKPSNVLLAEDGRLRLADFGLARDATAAHDLSATGDVVGTPAYMAPEQVRGESGSAFADVYALGVVACECLTLDQPFQETTLAGTAVRIANSTIADANGFALLPANVRAVLQMATAPEPRRRYSSAAAFAADLERLAAGQPVAAVAPGPLQRLGRWRRRHRGLATTLALLVGGLALTTVFLWRERQLHLQAQDGAERARQVACAILFERSDAGTTRDGEVVTEIRRVRQATTALQQLATDDPSSKRLRVELCIAWTRLGDLHGSEAGANLGDHAGAERCYTAAEGVAQALRDEPRRACLLAGLELRRARSLDVVAAAAVYHRIVDTLAPDGREARMVRGAAFGALAQIERDRGELAAAAGAIAQARSEFAADPDDRDSRVAALAATVTEASVVALRGDPTAAESLLTAMLPAFAVRGAERLAQARLRVGHASTLANCVLMQGRVDEARELFAAAVARSRELCDRDDADRGAVRRLAQELRIQAHALRAIGDAAAADAAAREADELTGPAR